MEARRARGQARDVAAKLAVETCSTAASRCRNELFRRGAQPQRVTGATSVDAGQAPVKLEVETASGPVDFRGLCGTGCHMDVDSVSGEVRFALDRASSPERACSVSTSGKGERRPGTCSTPQAGRTGKGPTSARAPSGEGDGRIRMRDLFGQRELPPSAEACEPGLVF